ncbi:GNAT family N-acetyltransferase [Streptomyces sanyensis]|uniref:GNAT family N-acetyltransferase n=1 Tax=Streptomyces sanyensis TaxID=568869 RepID=UPI003D77CAEE
MDVVELPVAAGAGPVSVTSPVPRDVWWRAARADDCALVTQTPAWLDAICATGPWTDAGRLYEFPDGACAVLPLVRRRGLPGPLTVEDSWPSGWGIGGPLLPDGDLRPAQAAAVLGDLVTRPALRVGVRFGPDEAPVWGQALPAVFRAEAHYMQVVDLRGGFAAAWEHFRPRVKRDVRRAERSPVEVVADRTGRLVPAFYGLWEKSVLRWAEQQHEPEALARFRQGRAFPLRRLEAVAERLGEACTVYLATCGGEPAAGAVVLRHGPHAKYWRGAMDRELANPVRANHLLQRLAIEDACAAGCRYYHMGDSRPGSSLAAFKASFGARGRQSMRYTRERLPVSAADRALRGAAKRLLRFHEA